jgi:glycerophosphoryl diester phosphodiesterase
VYLALLSEHDINYYLAQKTSGFWIAAALGALLAIGLVALVARTIPRWTLALPLVLFENVPPRQALGESARRSAGSRGPILVTLLLWASVAATMVVVLSWLLQTTGREIAPHLAGSLGALLAFATVFSLIAATLVLAVGVINISLLSLLVARWYLRVGDVPATDLAQYRTTGALRLTGRAVAGITFLSLLAMLGVALVAFLSHREQHEVLVIAHRGSSAVAPENTLAAFRLSADQRTDFVELDVQESADGEVLVVHDSDLMKVGGNPTRIWDGTAAALRSVDIGSFKTAEYSSERVPTLAEALAACKGRCGVIVELKSYGHHQQLEQRVAAIVEAAGMQDSCVFMSLDHEMVRRMKALRPNWRVGLLVAKALGDLTDLRADFLAVEARAATRPFVRRAHRAHQDVYVWTVNDPAWMLVALSHGVDGLITDKPALARRVIERRAQMSTAQRFLVAQLIRMGASTDVLAAEDALRP